MGTKITATSIEEFQKIENELNSMDIVIQDLITSAEIMFQTTISFEMDVMDGTEIYLPLSPLQINNELSEECELISVTFVYDKYRIKVFSKYNAPIKNIGFISLKNVARKSVDGLEILPNMKLVKGENRGEARYRYGELFFVYYDKSKNRHLKRIENDCRIIKDGENVTS